MGLFGRDDADDQYSIGESSPFRVAFAVPPSPGTLEMRDPAGRTVLTCRVD